MLWNNRSWKVNYPILDDIIQVGVVVTGVFKILYTSFDIYTCCCILGGGICTTPMF